MLVVADNLSTFTMGAGEPFLLQIEFQDSSGKPVDITQRSFVLSFYKADRTLVQQLTGFEDVDGEDTFLRFEEPGSWSEGLYGGASLRVELAERFLNGRNVISTGTLTINATAASVPSFGNAQIGTFATRVVLKDSATPGGAPVFSQRKVAFLPQGYAVPAPSILIPPSIGSDVIPQVGGQLTGVAGSYANGTVTSRQWLLGGTAIAGANGATYVAATAGQLTYSETVTGAGGTITATSVPVTVAPAAAIPSFTAQPAITGTPLVGSVAGLTPGTIANGTVGAMRLRKDGVDFADASSGSIQWATAGSYVLRVTIAGTAIYQDSAAAVVTVPVASGITAPTIYFDPNRVAGTNPPEVYFDEPDNTSLATDTIEGQQVSGGSTKTLDVASSIAALTSQDFVYSDFDNLAAGLWSFQVRLKRTQDADGNPVNPPIYSPWSNVLSDTLAAKALPPATTTWDQNNKFTLVTLSNGALDMQGSGDSSNAPGGIDAAGQTAISTQSRTDARYYEGTLKHQFYAADQYGDGWVLGVCPGTSQVTGPGFAPGFDGGGAYFGHGDLAVGGVVSQLVTPASGAKDANGNPVKDGNCRTWKNGVFVQDDAHAYTSYKIWACTVRDQQVELNTGQSAFAYPGLIPAGVKRFN